MAATADMIRAASAIERWRADPVLFCREVLDFDPWEADGFDSQADVLRAVPHHRSIAVRSGHKTGKSKGAAGIAIWAYALHPGARVILTAPTWRQVKEVIWREVSEMWRSCAKRGIAIGGRLSLTPDNGINDKASGRQIIGISTDDPDYFSGISGPHVFYIADEASGIADSIHEAIEGNRAGGAHLIALGNPTRTEGWFYRAFHAERDAWRTFHLSSENTPPARGIRDVPGLAAREWIEGRRRAWHPYETHPIYAVRVLGNFPLHGTNQIVGLALVEEAQKRWVEKPGRTGRGGLVLGLDVARFGDDRSVLAPRRAKHIGTLHSTQGMDGPGVGGWALNLLSMMRMGDEQVTLNIDVVGVGASVYDHCAAHKPHGVQVRAINVGEAADDSETYQNLRAELLFKTAEWLADDGMLPPDHELASELLAPTYRYNIRNRIQAEGKDDIKARLGRSPDKADAVMLTMPGPIGGIAAPPPENMPSSWGRHDGATSARPKVSWGRR